MKRPIAHRALAGLAFALLALAGCKDRTGEAAAAASTPSATALCLERRPEPLLRQPRGPARDEARPHAMGGSICRDPSEGIDALRQRPAHGLCVGRVEFVLGRVRPEGAGRSTAVRVPAAGCRKFMRAWVHQAWQMHQDGLDLFAHWVPMARQRGLSPFLSVRMNDLHNVEDEKHSLHSTFWKSNPQFRRRPI